MIGRNINQNTPIHPCLFALYPALCYLSNNAPQVEIAQVWRTFVLSLALVIGIWLIFNILTRSKERSALISSLIILLLLSFGNMYELLHGRMTALLPLGRADVLTAVYAATFILGTWSIWRVVKRVDRINAYLNVVALIAVIFPLIGLASFYLQMQPRVLRYNSLGKLDKPVKLPDSFPDIYYIILDGYGRPDFLRNYYGLDTSEFDNFLVENGFYIAEGSHSNYNQTALSLASSLNYEHLDQILDAKRSDSENRQPLKRLVRENRLVDILKSKGYTFITFSTACEITEIRDADIYVDTLDIGINSYEKGFLINTAAIFWMDKIRIASHRTQLRNTLDQLGRVSEFETGTPRFIFAHVLLPHPPFAFGPMGEDISFTSFLQDGNGFDGSPEEYIKGYTGQLTYLNMQIENAIAQILQNSKSDPIIVIQGDHGPGAYLNWDTIDQTCFQERMGILNAYHLPGKAGDLLYPTITPVNTFRLILNEYFNAEYTLLEDRIYFAKWSSPYQYIDITTKVDQCNLMIRN